MTRLDALRARLAVVLAEDKDGVAVSPECPYTDAELDLLDHARVDIERLVAVVDVARKLWGESPAIDDTQFYEWQELFRESQQKLNNALAYWLEPIEE